MVHRKKPMGPVMRSCIDMALQKNLFVTVHYGEDNYACDATGRVEWLDEYHVKIFDQYLKKWIFIPIENVTSMTIEKFRPKSTRSNHGSRCHGTRKFSYQQWWKHDNVEEAED